MQANEGQNFYKHMEVAAGLLILTSAAKI